MSDREGYLKRRDQLLMQDERIAELEAQAKTDKAFIDMVVTERGGLRAENKALLENIRIAGRLYRENPYYLPEIMAGLEALLGVQK